MFPGSRSIRQLKGCSWQAALRPGTISACAQMQSLTAARPYGCDKDKDPTALLPAHQACTGCHGHFQGAVPARTDWSGAASALLALPRPSHFPPLCTRLKDRGPQPRDPGQQALGAHGRPAADTRLPACSCARSLVSAPASLLLCPCLPRARPASPAASTKGFVCARPLGARTQPLRSGVDSHTSQVSDSPRSRFWRQFLQKADEIMGIVTQE